MPAESTIKPVIETSLRLIDLLTVELVLLGGLILLALVVVARNTPKR